MMQLHTGAEHFGNVIFRYSELPSQYQIDASIDVYHTWQARDKTTVSQRGTVAVWNSFERSILICLFQFRHFYNFPSDKIASSLHMKMKIWTLRQLKSDRSINNILKTWANFASVAPSLSRGYTTHSLWTECKLLWHFYAVLRYT